MESATNYTCVCGNNQCYHDVVGPNCEKNLNGKSMVVTYYNHIYNNVCKIIHAVC